MGNWNSGQVKNLKFYINLLQLLGTSRPEQRPTRSWIWALSIWRSNWKENLEIASTNTFSKIINLLNALDIV